MKKYILKEYDNGKIIYYKAFKTESEILDFLKNLKNKNTKVQGPVEKEEGIVYWIDDKLTFNI